MPTRDYKLSLHEELQDPEFAVAYLNAALEEGSQEVFLLYLRDLAEAWGGWVSSPAKRTWPVNPFTAC